MPEITIPKASVWMEYELDTQLITPPKIKLKLKPLMKKDKITLSVFVSKLAKAKDADESTEKEGDFKISPEEIVDFLQANMDFVLDFIIGWDLEKDKKLIPISKENKRKWLEPLLWEDMKREDEEEKTENDKKEKGFLFLGIEIVEFCSNMKNFTKN